MKLKLLLLIFILFNSNFALADKKIKILCEGQHRSILYAQEDVSFVILISGENFTSETMFEKQKFKLNDGKAKLNSNYIYLFDNDYSDSSKFVINRINGKFNLSPYEEARTSSYDIRCKKADALF